MVEPQWITAAAGVIGMLIGIGISYGMAKTTISNHEKRIAKIEQIVENLNELRIELALLRQEIQSFKEKIS